MAWAPKSATGQCRKTRLRIVWFGKNYGEKLVTCDGRVVPLCNSSFDTRVVDFIGQQTSPLNAELGDLTFTSIIGHCCEVFTRVVAQVKRETDKYMRTKGI